MEVGYTHQEPYHIYTGMLAMLQVQCKVDYMVYEYISPPQIGTPLLPNNYPH